MHDARVRRNLTILLSASQTRRISTHAAVRRLPSDLIRLMSSMIPLVSREWEEEIEEELFFDLVVQRFHNDEDDYGYFYDDGHW